MNGGFGLVQICSLAIIPSCSTITKPYKIFHGFHPAGVSKHDMQMGLNLVAMACTKLFLENIIPLSMFGQTVLSKEPKRNHIRSLKKFL